MDLTVTRELLKAVADRLEDRTTYVDFDGDVVDGSFNEVVQAVVDVINSRQEAGRRS